MQDRAALIVSVGLAALGWLLTHYVDRLTETPTIEYSISESNCSKAAAGSRTCDYRYDIANLSRTTMFGAIRFDFQKPGTKIADLWVDPVEPAHEGDWPPKIVPTTATFQLASLMPGGTVSIFVRATGPRPTMFMRSGQAIRMSPPTLETSLVRHEMTIMVILLLLWGAVVGFLILKPTPPPPAKDPLHRHLVSFSRPEDAAAS